MKELFRGVMAGALVTPFSSVLYFILAWMVYPVDDPEYTFYRAVVVGLFFGVIGIAYSAVVLIVYATPIYLLFKKFNFANIGSCIIIALIPATIMGFLLYPDLRDVIQFAWFSVVSGCCFWWGVKSKS